MRSTQYSSLLNILFRIDGVNLGFKLCHQYEEKALPVDDADPGELRRGGDYARLAPAGTDLAQ